MPSRNKTIAFFGAANQRFPSFKDQTCNYVQTYCSGLTDIAKPTSYILPPRFAYNVPHEVCDKDCRELEAIGASEGKSRLKERYSNDAEKLVFDAILKLIDHEIGGPFLAVHSLNLNGTLKDTLHQLFPSLTEAFITSVKESIHSDVHCFREYDFILIGPRIGLIAIEVKGSKFAKGFADNQLYLPERYVHGLTQLNSVDQLVSLFNACGGFKVPAGSIRKIHFASRLQRFRYDSWFSGLTDDHKRRIETIVGLRISQWFEEEDLNDGSLFEKLRAEIEKPGFEIDDDEFRRGVWIVAGLKSFAIFRNADISTNHGKEKMASVFCPEHAFGEDYETIERGGTENNPQGRVSVKISSAKVVYLTFDQQTAAKGPNRHLLMGTAGTGKTLILMQHAIDLMQGGQSVLILAMESFTKTYQNVFETNGCKNYEIRSWAKVKFEIWSKIRNSQRILYDMYRNSKYVVELASEFVVSNKHNLEYLKDIFELLSSSKYDAILIDDAFDHTDSARCNFIRTKSMFLSLALMAFGNHCFPHKSVWVAFDVYIVGWMEDRNYRVYRETVEKLIKSSSNSSGYFYCSKLDRVLRNTENVFSAAFDAKVAHQLGSSYYSPFLGLKVIGRPTSRMLISSSSLEETEQKLWSNVSTVLLDRFLSVPGACSFGQIGILVGGSARSVRTPTNPHGTSKNQQTDQNVIEQTVEFLLKKCAEFKIPAERLDWISNHESILSGSTECPSTSTNAVNDKVTIDSWQQASSREWTRVIFVEVANFRQLSRPFNDIRTHQGYRARTRAIGELVEILIIEHYSDAGGVELCCSKEVDLYRDMDGNSRYFQSDIHTTRCKGFRNNFPKRRLANLNDSIEFSSHFRDDLHWDIEHNRSQLLQRKGGIRRMLAPKDEFGNEMKQKKEYLALSDSVHDLRSMGPVIDRHPALNLDCDLYEQVVEKLNLTFDYDLALKMEDIPARQLADSWKKWNVIRLMERSLTRNKEQLTEEQLDALATYLESFPVRGQLDLAFEISIDKVMNLLSPIRAEYLRVNIMELFKNETKCDYRDFMKIEQQICWRY